MARSPRSSSTWARRWPSVSAKPWSTPPARMRLPTVPTHSNAVTAQGDPTPEEELEAMPGFYPQPAQDLDLWRNGRSPEEHHRQASLGRGRRLQRGPARPGRCRRTLSASESIRRPPPARCSPAMRIPKPRRTGAPSRTWACRPGLLAPAGGMDGGLAELSVHERFGRHLVIEPYDASVVLCGQLPARLPQGERTPRCRRDRAGAAPVLAHAEPDSTGR